MRLRPLPLLAALLASFAGGVARAQVERFARSERAMARDLKRLANVPRIASLDKLLESKSALTGSRVKKGGDDLWREGSRSFSVDMGGGCTLSGRVQRYDFPFGAVTKLHELSVEKDGKRASLMPSVPVKIDYGTSFSYASSNGSIDWHGPVSTFSLIAFFHEAGHARDYAKMSEAERGAFATIYDRKTNEQSLTPGEKRAMVGFERRAWASALRQARDLKRQGIDLLGGVSRKELMQTINGCLKGYYDYQGKTN
jgi:hypothetical protein